MSSLGKVIVIGIDGASPYLISKGTEKRRLDTFKRIHVHGVSGILKSIKNPLSAPAWASFLTGRNPGKHNIFDFYKLRGAGEHRYRRPVNGGDIRVESVYEMLSKQGKRVGLLNVPMTYPPKRVNGFLVTGLETPFSKPYTYPPELQEELSRMEYVIELDQCYLPGREEGYIHAISEVRSKKEDVFFYLIEKFSDLDFIFCVFRHIDLLSHAFWKFTDPLNPHYDSELARKYGEAILDGYVASDRFLSKLIARMEGNDTLFVVSDHGFGPQRKKANLGRWLCDKGYSKFRSSPLTWLKLFLRDLHISPLKVHDVLVKSKYFQRVMRRDTGTMISGYERLFLSYNDLHWKKSTAYATGASGGWGQIYLIGGRGRNPDSLIQDIKKELREIRDQNQETIVEEVYEKGEIYSGDFLDEAPDLLVQFKEGYASYPLYSDNKMISDTPLGTTGGHHEDGILYIYGSDIREGLKLNKARIVDMAPTLLYMYNLPISKDIDGRILLEAFKPGSKILAKRPTYVEPSGSYIKERALERVYTKEEEEEIKRRLKSLGYL